MNNTCVILVLLFALVSCILSSYLDIPPPPERPLRFKTKEQIETYLKAVKDYYDAFKVKLVRRDGSPWNLYGNWPRLSSEHHDDDDSQSGKPNEGVRLLKELYQNYKQDQPSRPVFTEQEPNHVR